MKLDPAERRFPQLDERAFYIRCYFDLVEFPPRKELSQYAPRIETIKIHPDKIGLLIGPGGKTIKGIVAETGAEINIEDDGSVHIYATSGESMARAKEIIGGMTKEIEIGTTYQGRVVSTKEFGAFVELFPGTDGLLHISEISEHRIRDVRDELKLGDQVLVKVLSIEGNKIRLSRKALLKEAREKQQKAAAGGHNPGPSGGEGGSGGNSGSRE